jgi:hypothetical protein
VDRWHLVQYAARIPLYSACTCIPADTRVSYPHDPFEKTSDLQNITCHRESNMENDGPAEKSGKRRKSPIVKIALERRSDVSPYQGGRSRFASMPGNPHAIMALSFLALFASFTAIVILCINFQMCSYETWICAYCTKIGAKSA